MPWNLISVSVNPFLIYWAQTRFVLVQSQISTLNNQNFLWLISFARNFYPLIMVFWKIINLVRWFSHFNAFVQGFPIAGWQSPLSISQIPVNHLLSAMIHEMNHGLYPIYPIYIFIYIYMCNCRRKFRSQTSDNMDRWKAEQGRGREKRKIRREKIRRERVRGQKIQMREKVGKSRNTVFFQWFVAPEGRKVGSLKRRVRTQLATGAMKNCTPLWREAHFQVKMYKTPQLRTTFGSCDVEKVHAVVARSTFPSQNVQNTPGSDHFWKLRCRKSARRCGAKHISKSKVLKTGGLGPLLEVQMSKKCRKSARRCGAKHISKSKV